MLQVITKGEAKESLAYYYLDTGIEAWTLGSWARDYLGQTLVICVEEPEEELDPIIKMRLQKVAAGA